MCSAVLAHMMLNEKLNIFGILGCVLCIVGSMTIVLHAPEEREIVSLLQVWNMALQPGESSSFLLQHAALQNCSVSLPHCAYFMHCPSCSEQFTLLVAASLVIILQACSSFACPDHKAQRLTAGVAAKGLTEPGVPVACRVPALLPGCHGGHPVFDCKGCAGARQQQHFCVPGHLLPHRLALCHEREGEECTSIIIHKVVSAPGTFRSLCCTAHPSWLCHLSAPYYAD